PPLFPYTTLCRSDGGGARAGTHQLDVFDFLAHDLQSVKDGGGGNNGSAMLIIVEDWYLHAFAQLLLDVEAFGRLDILQIDAAQGGLERGNDVDQLVGISFIQLDVEHINAGELLEQAAFAFHDGFGGQGPDIAQPQHGCAIG